MHSSQSCLYSRLQQGVALPPTRQMLTDNATPKYRPTCIHLGIRKSVYIPSLCLCLLRRLYRGKTGLCGYMSGPPSLAGCPRRRAQTRDSFNTISCRNMQYISGGKVGEGRSHAFPPHCKNTPLNIYAILTSLCILTNTNVSSIYCIATIGLSIYDRAI